MHVTADISYEGIRYSISGRKDDSITKFHLANKQFYELDSLRFITKILSRFGRGESLVIDGGANIGNHTVFLSSQVEGCSVLSFEMNPETFGYLSENVEGNALGNVTLVNKGLSNEERRCGIVDRVKDPLGGAQVDLSREGEVQLTTIDRYFDEFPQSAPVRLLKLDVEGHEYQSLQGAEHVLKNERPLVFFECKEESEFAKIFDFVEALGFEMVWTAEGRLPNFLFAAKEMVDALFSKEELYRYRRDLCLRHVQTWQLVRELKIMQAEIAAYKRAGSTG